MPTAKSWAIQCGGSVGSTSRVAAAKRRRQHSSKTTPQLQAEARAVGTTEAEFTLTDRAGKGQVDLLKQLLNIDRDALQSVVRR